MEKIEVKDAPASSSTYKLDDGRYLRVSLRLLTADDRLADATDVEVESTAFEVNKAGDFIVDNNNEPIMLPKQRARIPLGNVRAGLDSVKAGWVRLDEVAKSEEIRELKNAPKSAVAGDKYRAPDGVVYQYTDGLYESVRQQRVSDFMRAYPAEQEVTTLTKAQIDSLRP